jgi:hypothetical protein
VISEDPLLRRLSDALADEAGVKRDSVVPAEIIAPRGGVAVVLEGLKTFINDELVTQPTPFFQGDRLRTEWIN